MKENKRDVYNRSDIKVVDYELLGAEKVNDNLYAFTLRL